MPGFPPEQPGGAVQITPTAADLAAIGAAYVHFTGWTYCPLSPVAAQLKVAEITGTGVKWAFGPMEAPAGCTVMSDGAPHSPYIFYPLSDGAARNGIFSEQPGGEWMMNSFESIPFPCPADLNRSYQTPRSGTPFVPLAILNALGVRWSNSPLCNGPGQYIPALPPGAP